MTFYHTNEKNKTFDSVSLEDAYTRLFSVPVSIPANDSVVNIKDNSLDKKVSNYVLPLNPKTTEGKLIISMLGLDELYYQDLN